MLSRKQVSKYLAGRPRFIKGRFVNGKFEPVAMLTKEEDAAKRHGLSMTIAAIEGVKAAQIERMSSGRQYKVDECYDDQCLNKLLKEASRAS